MADVEQVAAQNTDKKIKYTGFAVCTALTIGFTLMWTDPWKQGAHHKDSEDAARATQNEMSAFDSVDMSDFTDSASTFLKADIFLGIMVALALMGAAYTVYQACTGTTFRPSVSGTTDAAEMRNLASLSNA